MPELTESLCLNLTNSLTSNVKLAPHFLQCAGVAILQTKTLLNQMDALRAIWHIKFPFEDKSPFTDLELIEK